MTPGYFQTMGIQLIDGRLLETSDRADTERVVVINQALAAKYFPGENPIGRRIATGLGGFERIVGVVGPPSRRCSHRRSGPRGR